MQRQTLQRREIKNDASTPCCGPPGGNTQRVSLGSASPFPTRGIIQVKPEFLIAIRIIGTMYHVRPAGIRFFESGAFY